MHTRALSGTYLKDEWVHWVLLHHGCTRKTVLADSKRRKDEESQKKKLGGLNLSDRQERGSARLNFLWPLPHWHTDSLNNMQTIECAFPCALHEIQRNLIHDFRQTRERGTRNNMLKPWFVHATSVVGQHASRNSWHVYHSVREVFKFTRSEL